MPRFRVGVVLHQRHGEMRIQGYRRAHKTGFFAADAPGAIPRKYRRASQGRNKECVPAAVEGDTDINTGSNHLLPGRSDVDGAGDGSANGTGLGEKRAKLGPVHHRWNRRRRPKLKRAQLQVAGDILRSHECTASARHELVSSAKPEVAIEEHRYVNNVS